MEMPALSISLSEQRKREYSFAFFRSVAFCRHWECVSEIRRLRTATERSTCWWMNTITSSQTPARMPCCHLFSEECNLNKGGVWRGWESKNCEKLISTGICLFLLDGISYDTNREHSPHVNFQVFSIPTIAQPCSVGLKKESADTCLQHPVSSPTESNALHLRLQLEN